MVSLDVRIPVADAVSLIVTSYDSPPPFRTTRNSPELSICEHEGVEPLFEAQVILKVQSFLLILAVAVVSFVCLCVPAA